MQNGRRSAEMTRVRRTLNSSNTAHPEDRRNRRTVMTESPESSEPRPIPGLRPGFLLVLGATLSFVLPGLLGVLLYLGDYPRARIVGAILSAGLVAAIVYLGWNGVRRSTRRARHISENVERYLAPSRRGIRRVIPRRSLRFGAAAGVWMIAFWLASAGLIISGRMSAAPVTSDDRRTISHDALATRRLVRQGDELVLEPRGLSRSESVGQATVYRLTSQSVLAHPYREVGWKALRFHVDRGEPFGEADALLRAWVGAMPDVSLHEAAKWRTIEDGLCPWHHHRTYVIAERTSRVLWAGVVLNAATAVTLILGLYATCWWWIAARDRRRLVRRWRALCGGRCPRCGYPIRGLRERRCPECGTTWHEDERTLRL
jgi:hypothetical protein